MPVPRGRPSRAAALRLTKALAFLVVLAVAVYASAQRSGVMEPRLRDERCEKPGYVEGAWTESDFLAGVRISKDQLGISADTVRTFTITCSAEKWIAPGSFLLLDGARLLTLWDGVFFEMRREASAP